MATAPSGSIGFHRLDASGDKEASGQRSTNQVESSSVGSVRPRSLAADLIRDGKLSQPHINANLVELMMAAVDTVSDKSV